MLDLCTLIRGMRKLCLQKIETIISEVILNLSHSSGTGKLGNALSQLLLTSTVHVY